MGLGRFQWRLAEPKLRSFFGLDEACKRWDQQASEAMDKGLEDLASTTRPLDDTLPYLEDNLDELLKSLAGEHVELSSLRSEEHTSELQSLMRISYAVFCLKKKTTNDTVNRSTNAIKRHKTYYELHNDINTIHNS